MARVEELTLPHAAVERLERLYRGRALTELRTYRATKRIRERRAA